MSKSRKAGAVKSAARSNSRHTESPAKHYWEMTVDELRLATKEFDQEFVGYSFGSPTAKQRAQLARAKRKRGRPRIGAGSKTISVTVEEGLLAKADRLAKKLRVPRATLIARGLRAVVAQEVTL